MSNRPMKKSKPVVEVTQEDFEVEWTPPPRTARDRFIQIGTFFLIIVFSMPFLAYMFAAPTPPAPTPQEQAAQLDEVEQSIKRYSEDLAKNPKDSATLANLGYYTNQKAARIVTKEGKDDTERLTLLVTAEKYLRDALKEDSDYAFAQTELAKNLMLQNKTEESNKLVAEALAKVDANLNSDDERVLNDAKSQKIEWLKLAVDGDVKANNLDAALEKMNQIVSLKPGEAEFYMHRAGLHQRMGNKEEARKDLALIVDIGQKTGNQQLVAAGQAMIESLDNPPKLEVVDTQVTEITPTPQAPAPATPQATPRATP